MPKEKPICETARAWLKSRRGKNCLAPLTGGTSRLFSAYLHLVDCWVQGRQSGTVRALREVVALLQPSEWELAAEAIAHAGDWCHVRELWTQIRPAAAPFYAADHEGLFELQGAA